MKKSHIVAALLAAGALATSGLVLQLGSAGAAFAAGKHAATSHKSSTKKQTAASTKKNPSGKIHGNAAGTSSTPHADGTITAITGDKITVKADNDAAGSTEYTGVTTLVLGSATKYSAAGGATTTTRPTLTVGERIVAEGTVSSDGKTLTATLVSVGDHAGGRGGPGGAGSGDAAPHADGAITGITGDTISVQADNDPAGSTEYTKVTTIVLTGSTQYEAGRGATTTTKPAIATGEHIVADGTLSTDGTTLTATHASIRPAGSK